MKSFHDKMGVVRSRPFYNIEEIDRMCIEELAKFDLLPNEPQPIRIDRYVEKRFGLTHEYEFLPDGVMGYTVFGPGGVERIVLTETLEHSESKVDERRLRTTLAHEAGHGLLHAHLFGSKLKKQHFTPTGTEGYQGQWWEYQANMAMGSLLLPATLFTQAVNTVCGRGLLDDSVNTNITDPATVERIADIFNVNPVVVRIRLGQTQ